MHKSIINHLTKVVQEGGSNKDKLLNKSPLDLLQHIYIIHMRLLQ